MPALCQSYGNSCTCIRIVSRASATMELMSCKISNFGDYMTVVTRRQRDFTSQNRSFITCHVIPDHGGNKNVGYIVARNELRSYIISVHCSARELHFYAFFSLILHLFVNIYGVLVIGDRFYYTTIDSSRVMLDTIRKRLDNNYKSTNKATIN